MADCNTNVIVKKSRKEHKCEHCWEKIPKGSSYVRSSGIFDGEPYSVAQHHECLEAYIEFNKDSTSYEWFPLEYMDNFREYREKIRKKYEIVVAGV